jgi:glycine hydroxymethyltransferase
LSEKLLELDFKVLTGGTDNHLLLINITNKCVNGKIAAVALEKAGIVVNYNMVPYDTKTPFKPSGIRLGTPAVTSRGMVEKDMEVIAKFIDTAIRNLGNESALIDIRKQVRVFARKFKVPGLDC